jgi:hypothetical protein
LFGKNGSFLLNQLFKKWIQQISNFDGFLLIV